MSYIVADLLEIAHDLEMKAHNLRMRYMPEVAAHVQLAVELLRKEIDLLIIHYENQQVQP